MDSGRAPLLADAAGPGGLSAAEVTSNAAVVLFGGIETTEGMICNAVLSWCSQPVSFLMEESGRDLIPEIAEESLRMEPAAAVVDRYATRDAALAGAGIRAGDLVRVSLTGANRDPAAFDDPDHFDPRRRERPRERRRQLGLPVWPDRVGETGRLGADEIPQPPLGVSRPDLGYAAWSSASPMSSASAGINPAERLQG